MEKRLPLPPSRPRAHVRLPSYPALAAAGLAFCLIGCDQPAGSPPAAYRDASADLVRATGPGDSPTSEAVPEGGQAIDAEHADGGVSVDSLAPDATLAPR